jgi:hypothetical protein
MLWEVFVTRFQEAFEQYERHRLSREEAGELLGLSGRNFRRLCVRYEEDGIEGLRDRRLGKVSPRRALEGELERMHELYRERYSDFTVKHFHEQVGSLPALQVQHPPDRVPRLNLEVGSFRCYSCQATGL